MNDLREAVRRMIFEVTGIDYAKQVTEEMDSFGGQDIKDVVEHKLSEGYKVYMDGGFAYNVMNPDNANTFRNMMHVEVERYGDYFDTVEVPIDNPERAGRRLFKHFIENNDRPQV